jgi:hypothetical protein
MIRRLATSTAVFGAVASLGCSSSTPAAAPERTGVAAAADVQGGPHLLWQNRDTGDIGLWLLDGTQVTVDDFFTTLQCGGRNDGGCASEWRAVDVDPGSNSILWWDRTTGHLRTWNIDSSGNVSVPNDPTQTCGVQDGCVSASPDAGTGNEWRPIGRVTAPFPPGGCSPGTTCPTSVEGVLWHDPISGTVRVRVFDSSGQVQGSYDLTQTCGAGLQCSQSWTAMVTGDFDGDGTTDLLWWNASTGVLREWLLNGPSSLSPIPTTVSIKSTVDLSMICKSSDTCSEDWRLVATADVNHDGHVDLLWHNSGATYLNTPQGTLRNWLLDGQGGVTGTQDLSMQCGAFCSPPWTALGYLSFQSP